MVKIEQSNYDKSQPQEENDAQQTESPNPATKILYLYLVKDLNGDILDKKEDTVPFKTGIDDKATGLTDQTVLEVITTQLVSATLDRIDRKYLPSTIIKIHSPHLVNALRQVIRYYPGLNLSGLPVMIKDPYTPLVHYMKELEDYKSNHPNGHDEDYVFTANSHIDILLGFIEQRHGEGLRLERERHQRQPPIATFEYLWLLFRPGDHVFVVDDDKSDDQEKFQPHVVAVVQASDLKPLSFMIWNIDVDTDDSTLEPYFKRWRIEPFEGEKEIMSLNLCPRSFLPNQSQVVEKFIARGKKVVSLFEPSYMEYSGTTYRLPSIEVCSRCTLEFRPY